MLNRKTFSVTDEEIPSLENLKVEGVFSSSGALIQKVHVYVDRFGDYLEITDEAIRHEKELSEVRQSIEEWHEHQSSLPGDCMTVAKRYMEDRTCNELEA